MVNVPTAKLRKSNLSYNSLDTITVTDSENSN